MLELSIMSSVPSIWASMNSWFTPTVLFVLVNLVIGTIAITSSLAGTNKPIQNQNQNRQDQEHCHHLARSPSVLQRLKSINFYSFTSQQPNTALIQQLNQDLDNNHFTSHHPQQQQQQTFQQEQQQQPLLSRSPSVLQRLKSINLYKYLPRQEPIFGTPQKTQVTYSIYHSSPDPTYDQNQELDLDEEEEGSESGSEPEPEPEQTLDEVYSKLQSSNKANRLNSDTKPVSGEVPTKLSKKLKKSGSAKPAFAHFEEEDMVESRRPATVREGKAKVTEEEGAEVDAKADDFINKFKQQLKLQRIDSIMRYKEMITRGTAGAK